jgi:hypothetical protein
MQFLPLVRKLEKEGIGKKSLKSFMYLAFSSRNYMPKKQDNRPNTILFARANLNTIAIKVPLINSPSHKNIHWIIRYRDNRVKYSLNTRESITPCAFSQRVYFTRQTKPTFLVGLTSLLTKVRVFSASR